MQVSNLPIYRPKQTSKDMRWEIIWYLYAYKPLRPNSNPNCPDSRRRAAVKVFKKGIRRGALHFNGDGDQVDWIQAPAREMFVNVMRPPNLVQ